MLYYFLFFFFQAEDGIRDFCLSRGLGDVYKRQVNEVLVKFALKYGVKIIASNDSHYTDIEDFNAHDILLCINTGEKLSTPALREFADDDVNMKDKRFAFPNDQFYFKKTAEMSDRFKDLPEAIDNTNEIVDKVQLLSL